MRPKRTKEVRKYYPLNANIAAEELRVVDEEGKFVGILHRSQALDKAREEEKDLVLIAAQANPPVAKIIDFKKFLYQEKKKNKEAKKGAKKSSTKDIKLSLFIGEMDYMRLMQKSKDFLKDGHQVRVGLLLRGRELGKKPMAMELMARFAHAIAEEATATEPKIQGKIISMVLTKKK